MAGEEVKAAPQVKNWVWKRKASSACLGWGGLSRVMPKRLCRMPSSGGRQRQLEAAACSTGRVSQVWEPRRADSKTECDKAAVPP